MLLYLSDISKCKDGPVDELKSRDSLFISTFSSCHKIVSMSEGINAESQKFVAGEMFQKNEDQQKKRKSLDPVYCLLCQIHHGLLKENGATPFLSINQTLAIRTNPLPKG